MNSTRNSNLSKIVSNAARADAQTDEASPIQASNFTLRQCDSWADLLQQPRIPLGRQHSVRLGINMAGAQQLGMVQLLCLEYFNAAAGADDNVAPLIDSGVIGPLEISISDEHILRNLMIIQRAGGGPYFLYQYFVSAAPSKVLELSIADTLVARAIIPPLSTQPINTQPSVRGLNQHKLKLNQYWYQCCSNVTSLHATGESLCPFDESANNTQITASGLEPAILGPTGDDPLFAPAPLDELTHSRFPALNPQKIDRLVCKALPKRRFQITIPKNNEIIDPYDTSNHLLVRIWINGEPFLADDYGENSTACWSQQVKEPQGSAFAVTLQLTNPLPQITSGDLVMIQFLFSHYENRRLHSFDELERLLKSSLSVERTIYCLSPILTMQDPLVELERNFD